jgi:hypothetical protein
MAMKLHKCKAYSISSLITWDIYAATHIVVVEHHQKNSRYYVKEEELAAEEK